MTKKLSHALGIFCSAAILLFVAGCESDSTHNPNDNPTPTPNENTTNQTSAIASDEIPLSQIVWLDADVSSWPITSKLNVSLSGNLIMYDQDGTSKWRTGSAIGGQLAGNAWVFIKRDGVWYGATHEWMRAGQKGKLKSSVDGAHIKQPRYIPSSWRPTPGEQYGFMVSGLVRGGTRSVSERTQIALMIWQ